MSKTALDVLRDARAYLTDRRHWTQNALSDNRGGVCTIGAIDRGAEIVRYRPIVLDTPYGRLTSYAFLSPDHQEHGVAYLAALGYIRRAIGVATDALIALWNDHPMRTHEEVLAMFDRAIALAEAELLAPLVLSSDDLSEPTVAEFPYGVHDDRCVQPTLAVAGPAVAGRPDRDG